jgi:carboxyl-terminal processing protease
MRRTRWILPLLCILRGSTATAAQDTPGAPELSATAYLDSALNLMQTHSLHRDEIDWTVLRAGAWERAASLDSTSSTYAAIRWAMDQLGDHHSWFWTPQRVAKVEGTTEPGSLPWYMVARGRRHGRIGHVLVPRFTGALDQADRYADSLIARIRDLDEGGTCGWIVDVRENSGGDLLPMLAGLLPFLGDEPLFSLKYADGTSVTWTYADYLDEARSRFGVRDFWPTQYQLRKPSAPVAVLLGPITASAGEAVVLAFRGRPATRSFGYMTQGLTTANEPFELSDGAMLGLTVAVMADRAGDDAGGGALWADELIDDERGFRSHNSPEQDPVLGAALAWLRTLTACP